MRALAAAAAACTAILAVAEPASAQDLPAVISPLKVEMDHNKVNLVDGKTAIDVPALSVPGAGSLRFDRVQNAAPHVKASYSVGDPDTAPSSHSIHSGRLASESFRCTGTSCESVTGTGSTFDPVQRYFREGGSGALWRFNLKSVDTRNSSDTSPDSLYYASSVEYPNGERIAYSYGTAVLNGVTQYRPATLTSNLGYAIAIAYQSDTAGSSGWGAAKEAALYAAGNPAPIGKLSYNGQTITDIAGRQYICAGCGNALGIPAQVAAGSFQLPGETSPTLQVAQHPAAPVVGSVTRDGVQWTYAYANLRLNAQASGYLYDRLTVDGPDGFHAVYDLTQGQQRNLLTRSTDPLGRATSYDIDVAGRPVRAVFPELNEVGVAYDGHGNITSKTTKPKPNSGLASIVETAYFDEAKCTANPVMCYRPDHVRDGLGRQTDFAYNARGQLVLQLDPADAQGVRRRTIVEYETSPAGISRRKAVRLCGSGAACDTAAEIRTEYDYWGATLLPTAERRIDAARGEILTTTFAYDAAGRPVIADGPLPGTDDAGYSRYDVHGRKTWEIGPGGAGGIRPATVTAYRDSDDRPVAVETGTVTGPGSTALALLSRTDTSYDSRRNPAAEAVSSGGIVRTLVQRSFQAGGRLECEARRMNDDAFPPLALGACNLGTEGRHGLDRITRNHFDAAGQLLRVEKALGTSIRQDYAKFEYTPNGLRKAVIDANGNRAEMSFDGHDRQRRWIFPSNTPGLANPADYEEYGYDLVGNRTSLRKRDGSVLTYQYDALNRVVAKIVPERSGLAAVHTRDVYYAYDLRGLPLRVRFDHINGEGITSDYDGFGRTEWTNTNVGGSSRTLAYGYDPGGRRSRLTWPDGGYVLYDHDSGGRPESITSNAGTLLAAYFYDPFLRLSRIEFERRRSALGLGL